MELIDRHDLILEILTHDMCFDDKTVEEIILDAPTIEAIPVKWLLEQSRKLPLFSEKGMYIDEILEDWEKELNK